MPPGAGAAGLSGAAWALDSGGAARGGVSFNQSPERIIVIEPALECGESAATGEGLRPAGGATSGDIAVAAGSPPDALPEGDAAQTDSSEAPRKGTDSRAERLAQVSRSGPDPSHAQLAFIPHYSSRFLFWSPATPLSCFPAA